MAVSNSRGRILNLLKTGGPQTAAELATGLGVTPMAVRQHLQKLHGNGLVGYRDEAGRVGRPRRKWLLTPLAQERFPDNHAELAVEIIDATRATFGREGLAALIETRTARQRLEYARLMPAESAPLADRIAALAAIRTREGYMAEWTQESDGSFTLAENNCPVCAAAQSCMGLCTAELELFESLLPDVSIERTEYILDGDRRCVYRIT